MSEQLERLTPRAAADPGADLAPLPGPAPAPVPKVRTVVVNYNGGDMTYRCLEALVATEWPPGRHEVVMVDNASTDGLADRVEAELPQVRVVRSAENLGFGGGCNLGMGDLGADGVDYVALVNNDAFVSPGWLAPLVDALEGDPSAGAASPRILFAPRFLDVELETETFVPGGHDTRELGVRLSGVEVDGADVWRSIQLVDGFLGFERGDGEEAQFQWTRGRARLRVPVPSDGPVPGECYLRFACERHKEVVVRSGGAVTRLMVGPGLGWHAVRLDGEPYDVVNNAGSNLVRGGFGNDRGYFQPDEGQWDAPVEVFAWCGAGVLLRRDYLDQVGRFDERFFLYYEDTDLAWRARLQGWRHVYVPDAHIRHVHSATTVEGSPLFRHFVERNRLLMLTRNAPMGMALAEVWRYLAETWSQYLRDVVRPRRRGQAGDDTVVKQRLRAFGGFLKAAPPVLADRRRTMRTRKVRPSKVTEWMTE